MQADCASSTCNAGSNVLLDAGRMARRRDVETLFEERSIERVRFIEQGQDAKLSSGQQAFQGKFNPRNKVLDQDLVGGFASTRSHFGLSQNRPYSVPSRNEGRRIIRANDAAAGGQEQGFQYARIIRVGSGRFG